MIARHVVLVGMMGSGKTTVGRLLAQRLDAPFVDLDLLIEQDAGRAVSELFEEEGEAGFRRREADALADVLAHEDPVVIATGGGAVLDPASRATLTARATVVWLSASTATLVERVEAGSGRPLLQNGTDLAATIARLVGERATLYREVARVTVEVDAVAPTVVADRVIAELEGVSA